MTLRDLKSPLDRALFAALTPRWDRNRIGAYFDNARLHDSAIPPVVLNSLQAVDTKAAGLLTRTSIMIAGLGLIAPLVADDRLEIGIILIDVACYVLIALGCLRCLSIFQSRALFTRSNNNRALINHEVILRRELYAWCNRLVIAVTIIVFVDLPFLFFYRPEH